VIGLLAYVIVAGVLGSEEVRALPRLVRSIQRREIA